MFLGIDTSCYTTSVSLFAEDGNLLADERNVLPVSLGEVGLRQSTALFYHVQNLPVLLAAAFTDKKHKDIKAIAVSAQPTPREGSYLPVFTAGVSLALSLANVLSVPLIRTTHQEGHLAAGVWSAGLQELDAFLALHLSGGTSELLLVERAETKPLRFLVRVLGKTLDIPAGQLVDRVGAEMNLPFPAGPELEKLAAGAGSLAFSIPSAVKGYDMSFSGAETSAYSLLVKQKNVQEVARAVEQCICNTVEKVTRRAVKETGINKVLLVGGVAANKYIRHRLVTRLEHPAVGAQLFFPEPKYSSDNAVGVGFIARSIEIQV